MKKIIQMFLVVIIIFSLTACTPSEDNTTSAVPSQTEAVSIEPSANVEPSPSAETSLTTKPDVPEVDYSFENNPSMGGRIAACGDKIFFVDEWSIITHGYGLFSCDIDGTNITQIDDDDFCGNLCYSDGWLYYTRLDGMFRVKRDGTEKTKILDKYLYYYIEGVDESDEYIKVMEMSVGKEKICYEYSSDYEQTIYLYTMNKDGTQNTRLGKLESSFQYAPIFADGYDFYIYGYGALKSVSGNTLTPAGELDRCDIIVGGLAYYFDFVKLNSINISTGEKREIELEFEDEEAKIAEGVILFQFHNLIVFERNYGDYHKLFAYDIKNGRKYALGEAVFSDSSVLKYYASEKYIVADTRDGIYKLAFADGKLNIEKVLPKSK